MVLTLNRCGLTFVRSRVQAPSVRAHASLSAFCSVGCHWHSLHGALLVTACYLFYNDPPRPRHHCANGDPGSFTSVKFLLSILSWFMLITLLSPSEGCSEAPRPGGGATDFYSLCLQA